MFAAASASARSSVTSVSPSRSAQATWKGGLIKLKTTFEPEIPGVNAGNMTIECHIGTDSEDDGPKFDTQGVRVDHYDEVVAFGTLFNHSADLE